MSTFTTKRLLHVEDDPRHQYELVHHLSSIEEFRFEMTAVKSEDEAMAAFRAGTFDLVVVNHQIAEGNGLDLLQHFRQLDPMILIIGISSVPTSEVAAALVRVGADDYFEHGDLTSAKLARSVCDNFQLADTVRRRAPVPISGANGPMVERFQELCEYFADRVGMELVQRLDRFVTEALSAELRATDIEELYRSECRRMGSTGRLGLSLAESILRPLMLELLARVLGDASDPAFEVTTDDTSAP